MVAEADAVPVPVEDSLPVVEVALAATEEEEEDEEEVLVVAALAPALLVASEAVLMLADAVMMMMLLASQVSLRPMASLWNCGSSFPPVARQRETRRDILLPPAMEVATSAPALLVRLWARRREGRAKKTSVVERIFAKLKRESVEVDVGRNLCLQVCSEEDEKFGTDAVRSIYILQREVSFRFPLQG